MLVTKLTLKNWRNFKKLSIPLGTRTYIIGANATGKSNLLDVFRFLRDICKPAGGGLQKAIEDRGGIKKLRCLQARTDIEVLIDIEISEDPADEEPLWRYVLGFKPEGTGAQRIFVTREVVYHNGRRILNRPKESDNQDKVRLTQTYIEQINANQDFREIADFFKETTYLHLVPQLLKHVEIASRVMEDDPFGQGLLQRIAKTQQRARDAKLRRIQGALENAVPQFSELKFEQDKVTGLPHLMASYKHWRNHGAWQREDQFSDGTLRLIGLLWMLQESNDLLLLEEPELSLNDAIVSHIPLMIDRVLRKQKASNRQVIITTHSEALLRNPLDSNFIILLEPGQDGTTARTADEMESSLMAAGLTPADVMLPKARPGLVDQLGLM
ncbi:TPA: AAA family ATPase [Pseudomonas aeruginosa]|uniref:AAA family ATPase n=4 Tax=Pseudomonas aeruginosa TaxID=287 RepID=UPI0031B6A7DE